MATQNLIQIKRSETVAEPLSLANGELAWSGNGDVLYIGNFSAVTAIAGERFPGVLTANQALVANSISFIDEVKTSKVTLGPSGTPYGITSIIDDDTMTTGVSNTSIASSESIKAYVDARDAAIDHDALINFVSNEHIDHSAVNITAGSGLTGGGDITISRTLTVGTGNGITVNADDVAVDAQDGLLANSSGLYAVGGTGVTVDGTGINIGQPVATTDDVTFRDITATGNLYVQGSITEITTSTLAVEDNMIKLASNNQTDAVDFGFYGEYDDTGTKYAGLFRDASDAGTFKFITGLAIESTGDTVGTGTLAPVDMGALAAASLTLTSDLAVEHGGTGKSSVTTNSLLYGQGTSALAEVAGVAYDVLQLDASGVPTFTSLDGGTF